MKKITIDISNEELDALEDLLVIKLSPEKLEKCRNVCIGLWGKMVKEYDKPTVEIEAIILVFPYSFCVIYAKTQTFLCSYHENDVNMESYLKALSASYKVIYVSPLISDEIYEEFEYRSDFEMYEKYFKNNSKIFANSPSIP